MLTGESSSNSEMDTEGLERLISSRVNDPIAEILRTNDDPCYGNIVKAAEVRDISYNDGKTTINFANTQAYPNPVYFNQDLTGEVTSGDRITFRDNTCSGPDIYLGRRE